MPVKPRHLLSKNWPSLRAEVASAISNLNPQSGELRELMINEWQKVAKSIDEHFFYKKGSQTLVIKPATVDVYCSKDPFDKLNLLIDKDQKVYFRVEEIINEQTKHWYYEGSVAAIMEVLGDVSGIGDYWLFSKKYDWLLGFNTHGVLFAGGTLAKVLGTQSAYFQAK